MMKISKILYGFLFIAITSLVIVSCKDDDEPFPNLGEDPKNIAEIAAETAELASFSSAIYQAGLDTLLRTTTTYNVFAPNNEAFGASTLPTEDEFTNALLNHIIITTTPDFTSTMTSGYLTTMATGPDDLNLSFYTNTNESLKFNGVASIVGGGSDIGATNGLVHIVDAILLPPTVADHAKANPNYSSFVEAMELADFTEGLEGEGPFTLFAPSNNAFEDFLTTVNGAFGWETLSDVPVEVLNELLSYHVILGENMISEGLDGSDPTTVQGETLYISDLVIDDASYVDGNIDLTDVQGVNGIVHGIDKVLIPEDVFQNILSATLSIYGQSDDKGYSTFVEAVDKAGLESYLTDTELTAFAPNNGAFDLFFLTIENYDSLDDFVTADDLALLKKLIEYHLTTTIYQESDLTEGTMISTVQGDDLTVEEMKLVPSHVDANPANFIRTNIGATNGVLHEIDVVLVSADDADALGYPVPATGGPVYGLEIYHDELYTGAWVGWTSPDFANTEQVWTGNYAIKNDMAAWEGFQIGGIGEDMTPFTTVNFSIYSETGTSLLLVLNDQWGNGVAINVPAGEYTDFVIPIANVANGTTVIDTFVLQDQSGNNTVWYLDQVGLDVTYESLAIPSFDFSIYEDELNPIAWVGWTSPDFANTEQVKYGDYAIKNDMAAWEGFQIGGFGEDMASYTMLNFSIYSETGTTLLLVLNDQWGNGKMINVPAGEYTDFTVPISEVANGTTVFDTFVLQDQSGNNTVWYLDQVGFDLSFIYPVPEFGYDLYTEALNPAAWVGWTSPDFANTETVKTGLFAIKNDMAAWEGFQVGGFSEDMTPFNTITFSVYSETGTSLLLVLNDQWGNGQLFNVPADEWTEFVLPISNVSNGTTVLDTFVLQDQSGNDTVWYLDDIGLN